MIEWYVLLVPIAVLAVIMLFRFAGCTFSNTLTGEDSYPDEVKKDNPTWYYRLQETGIPATAADEMNHKQGTYGVSPSPLDDPLNLSPKVLTPSIELGAPSIVPKDSNTTAVKFNGSDVFATGPLGNLQKFTVEAIVHPGWDVMNGKGFFYCVFENSMFLPGQGAPPPRKNAGFAIFAGPHDPSNATTSPYCWQLWVGTGTDFQRANPVVGGPVPPVDAEDTYLAVTFNDTQAFLYVYTKGGDIDMISHELIRPPYLRATHPPGDISLRIGIAGGSAALVPPFPGPTGLLYPFVGRMAEVAIYETVLDPGRIKAHIMAAFNT